MNTIPIIDSGVACKEIAVTSISKETIEPIYHRHVSVIYKICYMMLRNTEDAEDAVQSVFMRLISKLPEFNSTDHERAWLILTAQNHCKNILKHSWRKKRVDIEHIEELVAENDSQKKELLQAVLNLKEKYRIVIYLFYYEGYKTEEIGRMLHTNPATIRTRLHIGRKCLRLSLEESE